MGAPGQVCPYCNDGKSDVLYAGMHDRLGLYPRAFDVLVCRGCGTARVDEVPAASELAGLYPAEYIIKEDTAKGGLMGLWKRAERRLFYDRVYGMDVRNVVAAAGVSSGTALDVGCGNGGRLGYLADAGLRPEGIETSAVDVEYITKNLGHKARLGTLTGLDFEEGAYSLITFFNVFEHLPDPAESAMKAFRLLRPGGCIAISGPVMDSVQSRVFGSRWIEVAEMPRHIYIPTVRGLSELLGRSGFAGITVRPEITFKLAHTMAESIVPGAIGAAAYRKGRLSAMFTRAAGAAVMAMCMPLALAERYSGSACTRLVLARKPGGAGG